MKKRTLTAVLLVAIFAILTACTNTTDSINGELKTAQPSEVNIKDEDIEACVKSFKDESVDIHSLLILKDGKLVHEEYFDDYKKDTNYEVASVSKSVTSIATGIAIDEGLLNLDDKVVSFFPNVEFKEDNENRDNLKIRHLLGMVTGHRMDTADVLFSDNFEDIAYNFFEGCGINEKPGEYFVYNNGAPFILSMIIQEVTEKSLYDYAKEKIFDPLEIKDTKWSVIEGTTTTAGAWGLSITPTGMAKIGQMIINDGTWNGKQIISKEYIAQATAKQFDNSMSGEEDWGAGYGFYFWRCDQPNMFRADGAGGQFILMDPTKKLVMVVTEQTESMQRSLDILEEFAEKIK